VSPLKIVDTDVLIDYLRGEEGAIAFITQHADEIKLSAISVMELYAGMRPHERSDMEAFLSLFEILPIDSEVARTAGHLKRDYFPSHGMGLADAIIAATALQSSAELNTLNIRHYPMFPNLSPPYRRV
jgi:predicted nucleic acid-binding protein